MQTTLKRDLTVRSQFKDKYYVYGLFKPDGTPFYIGKGRGNRINNHFSPSNLLKNTRKNNYIKKHFSEIKREILCYFEDEVKAYDYEVWLIGHYGLVDEGGVLYNYAKTIGNTEYSESFKSNVSALAYKEDAEHFKYSQETVVQLYKFHFEDCLTGKLLADASGIPEDYSYYLISGKKHKRYFEKWVKSGIIKDNISNIPQTVYTSWGFRGREYSVSDKDILSIYYDVCSGETSLEMVCEARNLSMPYLRSIFQGDKRKYLGLRVSRDTVRLHRGLPTSTLVKCLGLLESGIPVGRVIRDFSIPKTTIFRNKAKYTSLNLQKALVELRAKIARIESGLPNGT